MMEPRDREELMRLLTELISAQDDVTHANEHGLVQIIQDLIAERNGVRNQIVAFVESLIAAPLSLPPTEYTARLAELAAKEKEAECHN